MKPTTMLVIGDGVAPTGFARVVHGVLENLLGGQYDIHHLAVNYFGDPHSATWKLYPASHGGDSQGVRRLAALIEKLRPQLVVAFNDPQVHQLYLQVLTKYSGKIKIVIYAPLDSAPIDPDWLEHSRCLSKLVVCTEFAKREVLKVAPEAASILEIIPHGVDNRTFFPYFDADDPDGHCSTAKAKRALRLFSGTDIDNSFIVLNANRNQPRKRIDITIRGFAQFAKGKPKNVKLFLHMGTPDMGWDILKLCKRYEIDDRLIVTENSGTIPGIDSEYLNLIYNACDVGINTATSEGWGLPATEHAATGKAQVVPRFEPLSEIWNGGAAFLEPSMDFIYADSLTVGHIVGVDEVAKVLDQLYSDKKYRSNVAKSCFRVASRKELSWYSIGKRWHAVFQSALKSYDVAV